MSKDDNVQKEVATEVAMKELTNFLKKHLPKEFKRGKMTEEKIEEDYIDVLEAIEEGHLMFDEFGKPVYNLVHPLKNSEGDISVSSVTFKSRIKGADKTVLMNGIDPKKQLGDYMIKVISYMTQLNGNLIKKLEKEDFDVLNQICSVF